MPDPHAELLALLETFANNGDQMTTRLPPRFWKKVQKTDGCWNWIGHKHHRDGYGMFGVNRKPLGAHRLSYMDARGEIPAGLVLDHLCRNRACVNPAHLEPVTQAENVRRGLLGHDPNICTRGHLMTEENTYIRPGGRRQYRQCNLDSGRRHREKTRIAGSESPREVA